MFQTFRELIIAIVLILSPMFKSSEISSGEEISGFNLTIQEGERVQLNCEATATTGNVTVKWFWKGAPIEATSLKTRISALRNGSLVINTVSSDDSGQYLCEVNNGLQELQSTSTYYLNVEYPAKVTFAPTIQYLPFGTMAVVQCHIKSNPPLQYATWSKNKRLLEPYNIKDILIFSHGSLLFPSVNYNHQGNYTCTPYNSLGTHGSSEPIQVLVRKPPSFTVKPKETYQCILGETVELHCDVQAEIGTQNLTIQWQRPDGTPLPKNRIRISGGNITIEGLQISDSGFYQCVASNEVTTIAAATQLVVDGSQPYGPYCLTGISSKSSVTLSWLPGYCIKSDHRYDYMVWYRKAGVSEWSKVRGSSLGSTRLLINRLSPGTTYEFQVGKINASGDGMTGPIIIVQTLDADLTLNDELHPAPSFPSADDLEPALSVPNPSSPRNVTISEINNGYLISWQPPPERNNLVEYYNIMYRNDGPYKNLNKNEIGPEETSYLVKNFVRGRIYYFKVLAYISKNLESSDEIKYVVPDIQYQFQYGRRGMENVHGQPKCSLEK